MKNIAVAAVIVIWCWGCAGEGTRSFSASPKMPVTLRISFDRGSYLEHEPIFVQWTLTNHQKDDLEVLRLEAWSPLTFRGTDAKGQEIVIKGGASAPSIWGPVPRTTVSPGKSIHAWVNLRDYTWFSKPSPPRRQDPSAPARATLQGAIRLGGRGEFRVTAIYGATPYGRSDGIGSQEIESSELRLDVLRPMGDDAKAAKFIEDVISKEAAGGDFPYYLHPRGQHVFALHPELCGRILTETRSARFQAVANFYLGEREFNELKRRRSTTEKHQIEASRNLQASIDNDSASPYLRGLARLYLLQAKMEGDPKTTPAQIKEMAEALIKDYPDSYMSQEAQKILEKVKKE